jgi:PPOX class probable F420-dependent enzyme
MPDEPVGVLDTTFSSPDASATTWADAREVLERSEIFWVTTVRPDGRPHVTPLVAAWLDDALYFGTGPDEQKARNLRTNPHCVLTTGCNAFRDGLDIVVEGDAERVTDADTLRHVAEALARKYGWRFDVAGDGLQEVIGPEPAVEASGAPTVVFRVAPSKIFAYGRGESFTATRWRF